MGVEERGIWTDTTALVAALASGGISQTQFAAMVTALQLLDNIVSGSEAQVDVVGALPVGGNIIGKVGHDITGITSGSQVTTTAGTPVRLAAASISAKYTIVQAIPANTKRVAVGGSTVDETAATVKGTILNPSESVLLPLDPYNIYVDPQVSTEGVTYNALT